MFHAAITDPVNTMLLSNLATVTFRVLIALSRSTPRHFLRRNA